MTVLGTSVDTTLPTVSGLSPANNVAGVSVNANLVMTFSENIQQGTGNVVLKKSSDNSEVETIAVSSSAVTVSGSTATIDPSTTLAESTGYYVEVASGAFKDLSGNDFAGISGPTTWTFTTGDFTAPAVTNLLVRGSGWTSGFTSYSGYSIPVGGGAQLATLPWINIDQVKIVFREDVTVDKADLSLTGVNVPQYSVSGSTFSYDPATFTATWKLPSAVAADKLLIRLNADGSSPIQDAAGNRLDGEWDNPTSTTDPSSDTYPSGNGMAGGDFVFRINVLPGDANGNGVVNHDDLDFVFPQIGTRVGVDDPRDIDRDGVVAYADMYAAFMRSGSTINLDGLTAPLETDSLTNPLDRNTLAEPLALAMPEVPTGRIAPETPLAGATAEGDCVTSGDVPVHRIDPAASDRDATDLPAASNSPAPDLSGHDAVYSTNRANLSAHDAVMQRWNVEAGESAPTWLNWLWWAELEHVRRKKVSPKKDRPIEHLADQVLAAW